MNNSFATHEEDLNSFLSEQKDNRHIDFIHRNISLFISNKKMHLSLVIKTISNNINIFSLINASGKEVHRFILTKVDTFRKVNTWVEKDLPITLLPSFVSRKEDVLWIRYHIAERMELINHCITSKQ